MFKTQLRLVVLPGKNPPQEMAHFYDAAYSCWKQTWEDAARELEDVPTQLTSTEFIRQDEVLCVFRGDECTSLGFWTELDFRFRPSREDFYFHKWTDKALNALVRDGHWVGKYSYLTVAKAYRKGRLDTDLNFKDLQVGVFTKRFLESEMHSMTGTTRNNRSVNVVCANNGAVLIETGLIQYGVPIDLMSWYKNTAKIPAALSGLIDRLWLERLDFRNSTQQHLITDKDVFYGSPKSA